MSHYDGTVPPDNPFVKRAGSKPEIFSYGHRNMLGLTVHPTTGDIWETENGPLAGDEVNILKVGANYGWPLVSYGRQYSGVRVSNQFSQQGFEDPVLVWTPSIAPALPSIQERAFQRGETTSSSAACDSAASLVQVSCTVSSSMRTGKRSGAKRSLPTGASVSGTVGKARTV